ncbi:hypothetical protein SDJN03_03660, partial [Cucurbita argyrosperma subsp. sororia]
MLMSSQNKKKISKIRANPRESERISLQINGSIIQSPLIFSCFFASEIVGERGIGVFSSGFWDLVTDL